MYKPEINGAEVEERQRGLERSGKGRCSDSVTGGS